MIICYVLQKKTALDPENYKIAEVILRSFILSHSISRSFHSRLLVMTDYIDFTQQNQRKTDNYEYRNPRICTHTVAFTSQIYLTSTDLISFELSAL